MACAIRGLHQLCFITIVILLDAHHKLPASAIVSTPSACVGTQQSDFTMSSSIRMVQTMRDSLAGCQFVIGDIHIININEQEFIKRGETFDLSFLDSIREITGCIKIVDSCFNTPISFKSLQIIRGRNCVGAAITVLFMDSCTMKIPPIDLRSLRYIGKGDVIVGGLKDCYIEKHINYDELFADRTNQNLSSKLSCLEDKESKCHSGCLPWPDGRKYCWGPGLEQCQLMSKCRRLSGCPSGRCYADSGGGEHCCSENCLGGCIGSTSKQCYGCTGFNKNGTCVSTCSPAKVYDNGIARLVEAQEKFFPLGPVCVSKCPSSFFVEEDSCVSKCTAGYSANSNRTCVKMLANRHCEFIGPTALLCAENNPLIVPKDNASQLCTEFTGDISIVDDCFTGRSSHLVKLNFEDLGFIFSRLAVVRGSIYITLSMEAITNLSFLSNLQKIDSNPKDIKSGRLFVSSNFIQYLGLSSLRHVANVIILAPNPFTEMNKRGIRIHFCPNFFPRLKAIKDGVITHAATFPNNMTRRFIEGIKTGFYTALCPISPEKCSEECDSSYGCWGPFSSHCVKCQHMRAGSHCVSDCSTVSGWFRDVQTNSLRLSAGTSDQLCKQCSKLCSECFGPNDNDCTACISSAFRDGSRCVEQCSVDYQFADSNRVCQSCPMVCLNPQTKRDEPTCTGNATFVGLGGCQFCTRVISELKQDGSRLLRCISARQNCPAGFYAAVLDPGHVKDFPDFLHVMKSTTHSMSICLRCADKCMKCSEAAGFCTECRHFQVLEDVMAQSGLRCTTSQHCPTGFFASEKKNLCRPCSERCSVCSGPTESDCLKCADRMYTHFPSDGNGTTEFDCVSSCPDSHPHAVARSGLGMTCSSSPASSIMEQEVVKGARLTTVIVGIVLSFLFILCIMFVLRFWFRQRSIHSKRCMRKSIMGWDEDMEPLNVTDTAPNVAVLHTISEKEIVRGQEVGSGAFGTVFRGEWLPEGETRKITVAIKILSDSLTDCNVSSELLEESRIMATVEHPHCVRLVGICMTQPLQLITQFMPLGNLRDFLRARKDTDHIGSSHLLRFAAQIASGMSYLEQRNIIHRDLACRNVLLASAKCVKITDFGLAKLLDNPNDEYKASGGRLPVKWLALECLVSRKFSHKSDVWAFGVTIWEIFMFGEAPYVNVKPNDLADYLEKGERLPQPPICTLDVYIIMIKCWMLNESQRPAFDDLEASFRKMATDPGRYVYIKGDKYARNPSNESGSTEHRSVSSSKSPSVNQLPSEPLAPTDPDDCNYSDLNAADMDNDVFRGELNPAQASVGFTNQPQSNGGHISGDHSCTAATSSVAPAATSGPSSSRQSRAYLQKGSQKYMNVKKVKLVPSHNDNKYTSDPCKVPIEEHPLTPRSPLSQVMNSDGACGGLESTVAPPDDDYLRPIGASSSQDVGSTGTSLQQPHDATGPPISTFTVQNPEYFFNESRRQYHNVTPAAAANNDGEVPSPPPVPHQIQHPMQMWISESPDDSVTENVRNLSYV